MKNVAKDVANRPPDRRRKTRRTFAMARRSAHSRFLYGNNFKRIVPLGQADGVVGPTGCFSLVLVVRDLKRDPDFRDGVIAGVNDA